MRLSRWSGHVTSGGLIKPSGEVWLDSLTSTAVIGRDTAVARNVWRPWWARGPMGTCLPRAEEVSGCLT